GRFRLFRQLMTESLLLSLSGGVLGLIFALWSTRLLVGLLPQGQTPLVLNVSPDPRVLGFTFAVSIFTTLVFGLAPAWRATGSGSNLALNQERVRGRRRSRVEPGKAVAVVEIALCVQLLVGAGLFIWTLRNLTTMDTGFVRHNVLQIRINPDAARLPSSKWEPMYTEILRRVAAVPGVQAASLANRDLIESGTPRRGPVHFPGYTMKPDENRQL